MSGIYLHIPFCKKRCYYCDFYSTTQLKQIPVLVEALKHELVLRKNYLPDEAVETVYFGGGTPSLLSTAELEAILEVIKQNYPLSADAEITIEANPDDLSDEYLQNLAKTPVN
jgi:oxygen-independent coproporphyrinogen-3 oxidase